MHTVVVEKKDELNLQKIYIYIKTVVRGELQKVSAKKNNFVYYNSGRTEVKFIRNKLKK